MSPSQHSPATTDQPTPRQRLKIKNCSTHPCITIRRNRHRAGELILLGGGQPC
jgi:hypothetical protein